MKIIIFAGGTGTRLWPLSREKLPKQFKKMFDGKSTLQLAVERAENTFGTHNIYISTNEDYVSRVKEQVPQVPNSNIVGEPEKRDLAAAIGYNFIRLKKQGYSGPVSILWADHLMGNVSNFIEVLKKGEQLVRNNPERLIFVGEKPRYAENNLGWIHIGKVTQEGVHKFIEWRYRPTVEKTNKMFESGEWVWNPGYFIVDLEFVLSLYKKLAPKMYKQLEKISGAIGTTKESQVLNEIYPTLEKVHFDEKILERISPDQAEVIKADMKWSDPGTLFALKEALNGKPRHNLTQGLTYNLGTEDTLIINEDENKLIATIGLDGMVVVNTNDAMIITQKDKVKDITKLVEKLKKDSKLKKFT